MQGKLSLDVRIPDSSSIIYYITINNCCNVRRNFRSNKAAKGVSLWNTVDSHYYNCPISKSNQDSVLDTGILSIDHVHLCQAPLLREKFIPILRLRTQQRQKSGEERKRIGHQCIFTDNHLWHHHYQDWEDHFAPSNQSRSRLPLILCP